MARKNPRRRKPGWRAVLFVTLALSALGYLAVWREADQTAYGGLPKAPWQEAVRVLNNPGFVTGYSEFRRSAVWTLYQVAPIRKKNHLPRPDGFSTDFRTFFRVESRDYSHSGYDRGHLAPNYAIAQLYGRAAQQATFRMSNISPQTAGLNRGVWQRLEEIEVDDLASRLGHLQVITGPLYWGTRESLKSGLEIPDAFYKILIDYDSRQPAALAFIVPQTVRGNEPLTDFVTTVDEIERRSQIDFLSRLDDREEQALESAPPDGRWRLRMIAHKQGRYRIGDP